MSVIHFLQGLSAVLGLFIIFPLVKLIRMAWDRPTKAGRVQGLILPVLFLCGSFVVGFMVFNLGDTVSPSGPSKTQPKPPVLDASPQEKAV